MVFICKYCSKQCKNTNSLRNHERLCKSNPNRQSIKSTGFTQYNADLKAGKIIKPYNNQFDKARKLGQPIPQVSKETRNLIRSKSAARKHTTETKCKISRSIRRAILRNPASYNSSNVNGRVKKQNYNGMVFDSKWEVIFAKFLNYHKVKWMRPTVGIPYEWNNTPHMYFPDFYLPEVDLYVEIKGCERPRDVEKYKSLQNLIVIRKKQIQDIKSGKFEMSNIRARS